MIATSIIHDWYVDHIPLSYRSYINDTSITCNRRYTFLIRRSYMIDTLITHHCYVDHTSFLYRSHIIDSLIIHYCYIDHTSLSHWSYIIDTSITHHRCIHWQLFIIRNRESHVYSTNFGGSDQGSREGVTSTAHILIALTKHLVEASHAQRTSW